MMNSPILHSLALALLTATASLADFPDAPPPPRLVGLATATDECAEQVFYGLQDILLGWDEGAQARFCAAVEADPGCALAHLGKLLTRGTAIQEYERDALLDLIQDDLAMTPAEAALVSTSLLLLQGDTDTAADEFKKRSEKWRADLLSACWAVLLLHDGYDDLGQAHPGQAQAMEMMEKMWLKHRVNHPCSAIVCYLRALMEETAPEISQDALQSAYHAANLLPHHPSPQLLLGHLLCRAGRMEESLPYLRKAAELAEQMRVSLGEKPGSLPYGWPLEMRARLYEVSALSMLGQVDAARQACDTLNAWTIEPGRADEPGAILLHWEARTLPLRLLLMRPTPPTQKEIADACKLASDEQELGNDPRQHFRECLRFSLEARRIAHNDRRVQAQRCIESAEKAFSRLLDARPVAERGRALSSWARACEACEIALNAARAQTYEASKDLWAENAARAARPSSLLMPPVVPVLPVSDVKQP